MGSLVKEEVEFAVCLHQQLRTFMHEAFQVFVNPFDLEVCYFKLLLPTPEFQTEIHQQQCHQRKRRCNGNGREESLPEDSLLRPSLRFALRKLIFEDLDVKELFLQGSEY